ncbi:unnamed protein product [Bathycoccus prasinos]
MIVTRRRRRARTRRTKNVFVRLINSTRTRCYQIIKLSDSSSDTDDDTEDELERLKSAVEKREGIPREKQSFLALEKDDRKEEEEEREEEEEEDDGNGGKGNARDETSTTRRRRRQRRQRIEENQTYQLFLKEGLRGGKGGFGTLLRSTGKKKGRNAEPNNDMCRDLKGQRYHVSENARKMEKWTKEESLREEEALALKYIEERTGEKARKRAKMEKEEERFRKDSEEVKERMEEAMKVATTKTIQTTVEKGRVRDDEEEEDDSDDEEDEDDFRRKKKKRTTNKSTTEEEQIEEGKEEERKVIKVAKANDEKEFPVVGAAPMSSNSSPPKQENFEPIDLHDINVAQELERFGLDHLKIELTRQNLKCGGSLEERANRLFLLKMTPFEAIDKKHKAMKKK